MAVDRACGTPALAYDVPGVRDAIRNYEAGILVSDDAAFIEKWIALRRSPECRRQLGEGAMGYAAERTWGRSVKEFLEASEAAIATCSRHPKRWA